MPLQRLPVRRDRGRTRRTVPARSARGTVAARSRARRGAPSNRHPSNGCRISRKPDAGEIGTAHRSRARRGAPLNRHPLNPCRLSNGCRIDRRTGRTGSGTGTRARLPLAATRPADADATAGGCRPVSGELSNVRRHGAQIEGAPVERLNGCRTSRKRDAGEIGTAHRSRAHPSNRSGELSNRHPSGTDRATGRTANGTGTRARRTVAAC